MSQKLRSFLRYGQKLLLCFILITLLLPLTGCWDFRHLDRLGVVLAVGIDLAGDGKEKEELEVTVQVVLPQNVSTSGSSPTGAAVTTLTERGDTILEAIRRMTLKTPRRLFFSHTQMILVGEKLAKKGIYPLVDMIERNPDIRKDILTVVAKGSTAKELLQVTTQMEAIPVNQMIQIIITNQQAYPLNYEVLVNDIARLSESIGKQQVVLPSMFIVGDKEKGKTEENLKTIPVAAMPQAGTMAIFRDGKLQGYLRPQESRGLAWLQNQVKNTVLDVSCPDADGVLAVEARGNHVVVDVAEDEEGMPIMILRLLVEGSIQEIMCKGMRTLDETALLEVGKIASEALSDQLSAAIDRIQGDMKVDALGWGQAVYRTRPALWRKVSGNWDEIFPKVTYKIECKVRIYSTGVRNDAIVN